MDWSGYEHSFIHKQEIVVSLYLTEGLERTARYCVVMLMYYVATRSALGNMLVRYSWQTMNNGI